MRALAALAVVAFHCWLFMRPPSVHLVDAAFGQLRSGVILFFALSGFLLYRPFVLAMQAKEPRPSIVDYFRNRALRIVPAYWLVLSVTCLLIPAAVANSWSIFGRNLLLVQNYDPSTILSGIIPAWSLVVEVAFYVALPLLVLVFGRRASLRRRALTPAVVLLILGLAGKTAAFFLVKQGSPSWLTPNSVFDESFLVHADLFAYGMIAAVLSVLGGPDSGSVVRIRRNVTSAGILVLIAAVVLTSFSNLNVYPYEAAVGIGCALFVLGVAAEGWGREGSVLCAFLTWRPMVFLGSISYGIFLWHVPVIELLTDRPSNPTGWAGFLVYAGAVVAETLLLAYVTYRFVELPALRRKRGPRYEHER